MARDPTDEIMAKQIKFDKEIREQVRATPTFTCQMASDKFVLDVIHNITHEWEVLGHYLETLAKKPVTDIGKLTRYNTNCHTTLEDM